MLGEQDPRFRYFVAGERLFEATPSDVWEVLSDFQGVGRWAPLIASAVDIGPTPEGVGAARRCGIRGLGSVEEVVTVWEVDRRLRYRVSPLGPIGRSESCWELERIGDAARDQTLVKLRLDYDTRFGPLGTAVHALLARRILVRTLPAALATLRYHVRQRARAAARPAYSDAARSEAVVHGIRQHGGSRIE